MDSLSKISGDRHSTQYALIPAARAQPRWARTSSMKMCVNSTRLLALTTFCSRTPVVMYSNLVSSVATFSSPTCVGGGGGRFRSWGLQGQKGDKKGLHLQSQRTAGSRRGSSVTPHKGIF